MKNFERRIKKIEDELNIGEDASAWWEDFRERDPISAMIHDEFFEKHKDDPDFVKEWTEGKLSDKTINACADYHLRRLPEIYGDPQYAHLLPPNRDEDQIKQWVSSWKKYWKARDEERKNLS